MNYREGSSRKGTTHYWNNILEGSHSGRVQTFRKRPGVEPRGFESLPLRSSIIVGMRSLLRIIEGSPSSSARNFDILLFYASRES
jgi:hypothetical protein